MESADHTDSPRDDAPDEALSELDELKALRSGLRAYAKDVVKHIQGMGMPATPLEADRTCRMVTSADRMLVQVYATLDKLPSALPAAPRAVSRGASMSRDKAPDPHLAPCDDVEDEIDDDLEDEDGHGNSDDNDGRDKPHVRHMIEMIGRMTQDYARKCGFWPDGASYSEDDDLWPHRAEAIDLPEPPGDTIHQKIRNCILRSANAMASYEAQSKGVWPGGEPYSDDSPATKEGYWCSAVRADHEGKKARALPDEMPGPDAFPWWMVHKAMPDRHPPP